MNQLIESLKNIEAQALKDQAVNEHQSLKGFYNGYTLAIAHALELALANQKLEKLS